jgi:hypothetical protein
MKSDEISLFKKIIEEILDSYSSVCSVRGCNDFDESKLLLSKEEREIAIDLINQDQEDEDKRDFIGFDFDLSCIARKLLRKLV